VGKSLSERKEKEAGRGKEHCDRNLEFVCS
jgi:hypothetical protein